MIIEWLKWLLMPTGHVVFTGFSSYNDIARLKHIDNMERTLHGKARYRKCPVCQADFITVWKDSTCGRWSCYKVVCQEDKNGTTRLLQRNKGR